MASAAVARGRDDGGISGAHVCDERTAKAQPTSEVFERMTPANI